MTIDIQAELAALPPITVPSPGSESELPTASTVAQALIKIARQQFKSTQLTEHAHEQLRNELVRLREESDERRREIERLKLEATDARLRLIEALDALDDLAVMARQRDDPFWIDRLQRFEKRCAELLQTLGVTELPGVNAPYDEYVHDVIETISPTAEVGLHMVVDQIKKGYRYDGRVLRRAQVITSR